MEPALGGFLTRSESISPHTGWVREYDLVRGECVRSVGTGHGRGLIEVTGNVVWVANCWSRTLARLNPFSLEVTAMLSLRKIPVAMAAGADALWVLCRNGWLWHVSPPLPHMTGVARVGGHARSVAADDRAVWTLCDGGGLTQLEPTSAEPILATSVGRGARRVILTQRALWVIAGRGRRLLGIDRRTGQIQRKFHLDVPAVDVVPVGQALWVVGSHRRGRRTADGHGRVWRMSEEGDALATPAFLSETPRAVTAGNGSIWIACGSHFTKDMSIEEVDARTGDRRTVVSSAGWPIDSIAVVDRKILAAMSVPDSDVGAGGGGGIGG